jgi:hypothetical protein
MKNKTSRRQFLGNIGKGSLTTLFTLSTLNTLYSYAWFSPQAKDDAPVIQINPAFKINVFKNGTVELYTHPAPEQTQSIILKDFEADVFLKILNKENVDNYCSKLGEKYSLTTENYASEVRKTLDSFTEKGYIYYGEPMKVKIMRKENE